MSYKMSSPYDKDITGIHYDGGAGSGNWGHQGRPGERGGSGPGGGVENRWTNKQGGYTSFAKQRAIASKPHVANHKELTAAPTGTKMIANGQIFTKISETKWEDKDGVVYGSHSLKTGPLNGKEVKMAIPKTSENSEKVLEKLGVIGSYDTKLSPDDYGGVKGTLKPKAEKVKNMGSPKTFKSEYSKEQIANAKHYSPSEALAGYKATTEKVWSQLNTHEKESLYSYTAGSKHINEPLQGKQYLGYKNTGKTLQEIKDISKAIDMAEIPADTIMYHGLGNGGFKSIMGLNDLTDASLNAAIGTVGFDNSFCSCGASENTGFDFKPVIMEIFVPEGSKGLYSDQFSHYTGSSEKYKTNWGAKWNGKTDYTTPSGENEVILQKGNSYKMTGYNRKDGQLYVQCELVGQSSADWMPEGVASKV